MKISIASFSPTPEGRKIPSHTDRPPGGSFTLMGLTTPPRSQRERICLRFGAGWLGKLGLLLAQGKTLAETLLLNLTLLKDGRELWDPPHPYWESDQPRTGERTEIPQPKDQAALLTLQSRRLILHREEGAVKGYRLLGGDFFQKENAFCEQMTLWRNPRKRRTLPSCFPLCAMIHRSRCGGSSRLLFLLS